MSEPTFMQELVEDLRRQRAKVEAILVLVEAQRDAFLDAIGEDRLGWLESTLNDLDNECFYEDADAAAQAIRELRDLARLLRAAEKKATNGVSQ